MCLITFAYRVHPRYPLILIANRDEFYRRPTRDAAPWPEAPELIAGQDLEQGGTWLGLHLRGRLAAVTNFRDGRSPAEPLRSRGHLTRDFLLDRRPASDWAARYAADSRAYGGFNLLLGDTAGLHYLSNRGAGPTRLEPGIYGLSNALLDTPWPKLLRARQSLAEALHEERLEVRHLADLLADRSRPADAQLPDTGIGLERERALSSCFIALTEYGTRATTVILQDDRGQTRFYEQSFGPQGAEGVRDYRFEMPRIG